jgi:hypothetical protein
MRRARPAWPALFGVAHQLQQADSGRRSAQASHDKATGKLGRLPVDAAKDGKPDIYSYMSGAKFLRIEIDSDEDGKIDR